MENFADYILDKEKDIEEKITIMCYLEKKLRNDPEKRIFFDKSIILKTTIVKMFIDIMNIDVDENLVITASLLCNCKKGSEPQKIGKVKTYAKEGAEYLATLGFDKKFCKICEEINRYSGSNPREKESDLLEVVDQFGGMLLDRPERGGYEPLDALIQLEHANLKDVFNRYLETFREFIEKMEDVNILIEETNMRVNGLRAIARKINIETPKDLKSLNEIIAPMREAITSEIKSKDETFLEKNKEELTQNKDEEVDNLQQNPNRPLFSIPSLVKHGVEGYEKIKKQETVVTEGFKPE